MSARTFCGMREGLASEWVPRPGSVVLGVPADTDLQGVHPAEAGVLHGQEDGAVLRGRPAAQEERGAVEGPLQGHQVQGRLGKQPLPLILRWGRGQCWARLQCPSPPAPGPPLHLAQEALLASLRLWAGEEGYGLPQGVSSEQGV